MVERLLIELDDIGITSLVIGVTSKTGTLPCLPEPAMEPRLGSDVSGDIFVAIKTQCPLFVALESCMAGVAVLLSFGVCRDDFAGHDQRLNLCARRLGDDE